MKKIVYLFAICLIAFACGNRESLTLKGTISGIENGTVPLILKTNKAEVAKVLAKLNLENGKFTFHSDSVKPPVCLTFMVNDSTNADVLIGKYGKFKVAISLQEKPQVIVNGDDMQKEYYAYMGRLKKAYLTPVKDKIEWVNAQLNAADNGTKLSAKDEEKFEKYEKAIGRAYSHRRLSLVKTVRKNPNSPVAMAVVFSEYNNLNKRHKAEIKKIYAKRYSDTALFWQIFP